MNLYHKDQAFGAFQDAFDYVCSYSKDNRGRYKGSTRNYEEVKKAFCHQQTLPVIGSIVEIINFIIIRGKNVKKYILNACLLITG